MRTKLILTIIIFLALTLFIAGCLNQGTGKANQLISDANKAINKYISLEKDKIGPLREKIDGTENTKKGAKKCLGLIDEVLEHIRHQSVLLNEAKKDISKISELSVNQDFKTYAGMTGKALDADLKSLDISLKLYKKLQNLYDAISTNELDENTYTELGKEIDVLSDQAEKMTEKQAELHSKKDAFYKSKIAK